MHLILTGATGLVGSSVLDAMLKTKEITKISILSRRPVPLAADDPRANVIIHRDFETYEPELLNKLQGANGVVWALGISQLKVTKEFVYLICLTLDGTLQTDYLYLPSEYITITKDFPLAAVKAFSSLTPDDDEPFRFIYVSGGGATLNPGLTTPFYGRIKGEAEKALSELRTPRFHIESVRPAGVDPSNHDAIKPHIPDPGAAYHAMGYVLGPLMRTILHPLHSPTEKLGPFLVGMAMGKYDKQLDVGGKGITDLNGSRILDNWAFRRLYGF
ncbi:hypothetical protein CDV31_011172 [Fusarium ambrosium]|uniref:NAD(P)-binding domain-containing protein n=1 Tax=Fusarium ambrosium TaxID=131363 RepID=A0A428TIG6_9HYPO|nr:hypothetical protein CDV31_011172 [Fusarium ambrosium]